MVNIIIQKKLFGDHTTFDLIDEELQQNKGIAEISSIKGFSAIGDWKGKDYLSFLHYYGIPFLSEYCDKKIYAENFKYLADAIFLCSKESPTDFDLENASKTLVKFDKSFDDLYGRDNRGPNFHELTQHLIFAVKNTGPLWINSTFNFEELNFINRSCVRSSLRPDIQIAKR